MGGTLTLKTKTCLLKTSFIVFSVLFYFLPVSQILEAQQGKSIEEYKRIADKNPADVSALNNIGAALIQSGKYQEAIEYLIKAVRIQPSNARAHFNLGFAYQYLQKYKEAADEYQASIQNGFKTYKVCYNLGLVLEHSGNFTEARSWYSESINMKSDFANAYFNLGEVDRKLDMKTEALNNYKKYLEHNPNASDKSEVQNIIAVIEKETKPPEVAKDIIPPQIEINEPFAVRESGKTVETEESEITLSGKVTDDNKVHVVSINDRAISLPAAPQREVIVSEKILLRLGDNKIKIIAGDESNNKKEFALNVNRIEKDIAPPEIVFLDPITRSIDIRKREIFAEVQSENIQIFGLANDKSGVLKALINNQEAVLNKASEDEKSKFPLYPDNTVKFNAVVPLSMGINEITITAFDIKENKKERILKVNRKRGEIVSKFYTNSWAILVGINEFQKEPWRSKPLNYASEDAIGMAQVLKEQFGFKKENITILLDKRSLEKLQDKEIAGTIDRATLQNIKTAMSALTDPIRVTSNDRVLIFFAGHGHTMPRPGQDQGEMGFIISEDGEGKNIGEYYNNTLAMSVIEEVSGMIPAKHVLFLVDACFSGLTSVTRGGIHSSIAVETLAERRAQQVITAGLKDEEVIESPQWGHSAFTFTLLSGLKTGSADENNDGFITAVELGSYLSSRVPDIASGKQHPRLTYFSKTGEGQFIFELPR